MGYLENTYLSDPWVSSPYDHDDPPMSLKSRFVSDVDVLDQIAGLTGLGWTAALLGYLASAIGSGNSLLTRLVVDPQSLLYVGGVLLVTTFGLDRLRDVLSKAER